MAEQWFYSAAGTKQGPVSSKELVALARSGKLRPTDLVWKDGMAEWKPAGKVKGLFPTTPTAAAPPPLPTPTPGAAPSDLATTAEGLFGAAASAVQRAVTKATEAAKQAQEALPAGTPPAPLPGRQKKGLLVVGSVLAIGVAVVAVAALIAPLRGERSRPTNSVPRKMGEFVELRAFADVPPPIQEAADAGHEVWELTGWHQDSLQSFCLNASLYVILEQSTLTRLFEKQHHKKGSGLVGDKGKDREVVQWAEQPLDKLPAEGSKVEWHWKLETETQDRSVLTYKTIVLASENNPADYTNIKSVSVVIDDKLKEGYWQGEEHIHIEYRGRMAKFPDENRSKAIKGGAVRLLGRRSPPRPTAQPPKADPMPDPGNVDAGVPPAAGVPKDAEPKAPPVPPLPEPKAAVPAVPEPKAVVPAKTKLIPVYKVVFPGDVLLTTNEEEATAIGKLYPGEFSGKAGHHIGTIGYAYAEKQPEALRFQRYLVPNTGRHAYWMGESPNPGHKAEGPGIWVPAKAVEGASRRLVLFRKDSSGKTEYEYGTERLAESYREKLGYQVGKDREFYLFDKAEGP